MKKIYLMALSAAFAMSVNAQTTIKLKSSSRIEKSSIASKNGGTNSTQQIAGTLVCNTQYAAGTTMNLEFTLDLTNTDSEYGDKVTLTFPAGITPNASGHSASIGTETLNPVSGQVISWGDNDNNFGGIVPGAPINFTVNVTIGAGVTGNQNATYDVSGDQYAAVAPAGDLIGGTCVIYPTGTSLIDVKTIAAYVLTSPTTAAGATNCSLATQTVATAITNIGTTSEVNVPINYMVNGVVSTLGAYPGPLNPGDTVLLTFPTTYNFSTAGTYVVKTWAEAAGDATLANDTAVSTIKNVLPIALTSTTYMNGIETNNDFTSITQSWVGAGLGFGISNTTVHTGTVALFYTLAGTNPAGTYATMNILPCMDVVNGDTYKISYWRKANTSGTLTVNGSTGIFTSLTNSAATMTTAAAVVKGFTPIIPNAQAGVWEKDSANYVATANETRYFAIGGQATIAGAATQGNVRIDDIKIEKVTSGVGIKTIAANDVISIFPNPTSGILNINAIEATSSVEVINVVGEKVYSSTLVKGNNVVDLSGLANGAYFVKLNSNGQMTTKKVVLSK